VVATNNSTEISDQDLIYEAKIAGKIPALKQGIFRRKVVAEAVQKAGLEPTQSELQQAADRFRLVNQLASAEATNQWLIDRHLSVDDFEYMVTQDLLSDKLAEHLFGSQVEKFFQQNLLDYSGAIIYEVILEDRDLAMEIFYSLQEGDLSFADVAHQYIPVPELRRRGGYIGRVGRKQLNPEVSAAVFGAKPPQLIAPIITAVGVHLIQVEEIITPQLDQQLHQQILTEMYDQWLTEKIGELTQQQLRNSAHKSHRNQ
jgi:parvulin-like peptidyl-prolyl isomerase